MGTVTLHSYNEASLDEGEPRMGTGYDEKLRPMAASMTSHHPRDSDDSDSDEDEDDDTDF